MEGDNVPNEEGQQREGPTLENKNRIGDAFSKIDAQIKKFQEKEKALNDQIESLRKQARELLLSGSKQEAKRCVELASNKKRDADALHKRCKQMVQKKQQILHALMEMQVNKTFEGIKQQLLPNAPQDKQKVEASGDDLQKREKVDVEGIIKPE